MMRPVPIGAQGHDERAFAGSSVKKQVRLSLLLVVVLVLVSCVGTRPERDAVEAGAPPGAEATHPNFLIVMADDQAHSTYDRSLMPTVFSDIVDEGMAFDRAYINTPLCCPSRAQTLTGLYEHHTAVADNGSNPLDRPTIVEALHGTGYRTMLAGKYLNSAGRERRPEFDDWNCYGSTSTGYSLRDPVINVNGTNTRFTGYTTDILAGKVRNFVASTPADQPFFALYTPTSPHTPADDDRYASLPVAPHRPPSYDEDVGADGKPAYLARTPTQRREQGHHRPRARGHDPRVPRSTTPSRRSSTASGPAPTTPSSSTCPTTAGSTASTGGSTRWCRTRSRSGCRSRSATRPSPRRAAAPRRKRSCRTSTSRRRWPTSPASRGAWTGGRSCPCSTDRRRRSGTAR